MARPKRPDLPEDELYVPGYLRFSKVIVWLMYIWVMIGVVSLGLRVFLLAFSANTAAGFANFIMRVSGDYLQPFRGIFQLREINETGYLDVSAIFAIVVYLFIAWGFKSLIDFVQDKIDDMKQQQRDAKLRADWEAALKAEKERAKARKAAAAAKTTRTTTTTTTTRSNR